jgi:hypothetical protein
MLQDKAGNQIFRTEDIIYLNLISENRYRKLGVISEDGTVITMRRNPDKHLLRVASAYGFCYEFLKTARAVKVVRLMLIGTKDFYHITVKDLLKYGDFLFFKKQGFEKQIFLTLEQLERYGIKN